MLGDRSEGNRHSLALLYCDRSEAFRKIGKFEVALSDANEAISLNPLMPTGYIRAAEVKDVYYLAVV